MTYNFHHVKCVFVYKFQTIYMIVYILTSDIWKMQIFKSSHIHSWEAEMEQMGSLSSCSANGGPQRGVAKTVVLGGEFSEER